MLGVLLGSSWILTSCSGIVLEKAAKSGANPSLDREATPIIVDAQVSGASVSPLEAQTVLSGEVLTFTLTPDSTFRVSRVVGGDCAAGSWAGDVYTTGPIEESCSVSFAATPVLYFCNQVDSLWTTVGNWFLDDCTEAAGRIPAEGDWVEIYAGSFSDVVDPIVLSGLAGALPVAQASETANITIAPYGRLRPTEGFWFGVTHPTNQVEFVEFSTNASSELRGTVSFADVSSNIGTVMGDASFLNSAYLSTQLGTVLGEVSFPNVPTITVDGVEFAQDASDWQGTLSWDFINGGYNSGEIVGDAGYFGIGTDLALGRVNGSVTLSGSGGFTFAQVSGSLTANDVVYFRPQLAVMLS